MGKRIFLGVFIVSVLAFLCLGLTSKPEKYIRDRVVMIQGNGISCTGVQIRAASGINYILTAGHCNKTIVEGKVSVVTEDGNRRLRWVLGEDPTSDLLLVEGLPNATGLDLATSEHANEPVRAVTHGGAKPLYETKGVLLGYEVSKAAMKPAADKSECPESKYEILEIPEIGLTMCVLAVEEVVTTASIVPGSSGGPVLNEANEVVGIASMTDGYFGYLVKLSDIRLFLAGY